MERADRRAFDRRGGEPGTAADPTPVTPASTEPPAVKSVERLLRMSRTDSRDGRRGNDGQAVQPLRRKRLSASWKQWHRPAPADAA